jgi:ATP-dependent Clp protease ATP-binding subunit ClpB
VLLDEIEKAHPDVFNVLLQVLDDGRLTDGQGRTVDFTNTVVIMTSQRGLGQTSSARPGATTPRRRTVAGGRARAAAGFKPEFLNRVDDVVVFRRSSARTLSRDRRAPARRACSRRLADRQHHAASSPARRGRRWPTRGYDPVSRRAPSPRGPSSA